MAAPLPPKDRYVSASAPVNRRTARQPVVAAPAVPHASVRQRLARVQAQHRLGGLLSQRLLVREGLRGRGTGGRTGTGGIAVAVGGTLSAVGLLVAWLQQSVPVAVVAVAGVFVAAVAGWWLRRNRRAGQIHQVVLPDLFDAPALTALDEVLKQLASEVSDEHLKQLRGMADTLERMAPLMRRVGMNEQFTQEDHFYVTECVRRYLPDTLQAYLQVPRHSRALAASTAPTDVGSAESTSADALLAAQLALLQTELARREQALNSASTEALQKQQRFLQAKGATGKV